MVKPIVNLDEVEFDDVEENGRYTSSRGSISPRIGAGKLGYNLTVLPPGKVQCPFHCHHGEEEMFLILEGEGELRFGDQRYPIRKHDVIACPTGGPEVAHQIINTGETTMRYLALSTLVGGRRLRVPGFAQKILIVAGKPGGESCGPCSGPRPRSTTTTVRKTSRSSALVFHGQVVLAPASWSRIPDVGPFQEHSSGLHGTSRSGGSVNVYSWPATRSCRGGAGTGALDLNPGPGA